MLTEDERREMAEEAKLHGCMMVREYKAVCPKPGKLGLNIQNVKNIHHLLLWQQSSWRYINVVCLPVYFVIFQGYSGRKSIMIYVFTWRNWLNPAEV